MTRKKTDLEQLMAAASATGEGPAVEVVQPEVRTGAQYALLPSMKAKRPETSAATPQTGAEGE
ncbi:hypothetical protein PV343_04400 [Streptomyces sp. WI03-4A]|uniref:hypothetical protein n=1 Tax=Streptomyces sp. WI03-4A TaxID=3028706 RepID=UPI0029B5F7CD|nr:hypothetical protein [Streptomyces sp. WI03-4A]MDX2591524.1 hypothetical protein [Streptomyces sp. WI03-4A]